MKKLNSYKRANWKRLFNPNTEEARKVKELKEELKNFATKKEAYRKRQVAAAIQRAEQQKNSKRVDRLFKQSQGNDETDLRVVAIRDSSNRLQCETGTILEVFNDFWSRQFTHRGHRPFREEVHAMCERVRQGEFKIDYCPTDQEKVYLVEKLHIPLEQLIGLEHETQSRLCSHPLTETEVLLALGRLDPAKATGLDDVPPLLVAQLKRDSNWDGEYVPSDWKVDRRIFTAKPGNNTDVSNWRPLAIHSVFRKILASCLEVRERQIVQLHEDQYGYRKARRTSDLASLLNDTVRLYSNTGRPLYVVVIDVLKAFDSCHTPTLIRKKTEKGIQEKLLMLSAAIYTNAVARLMINDRLGQSFPVTRGFAQGCVLSPLSFLIYIDDLLEE